MIRLRYPACPPPLTATLLVAVSLGVVPRAAAIGAERNAPASDGSTSDWPWWRGPTRDGVAPEGPPPPLKWSEAENVRWSSPVPGRGHGSPTVVGGQVFLATADPERQVQSVLCFDRANGSLLWQADVHRGGWENKGNTKSSLASATVACDGERLFVNFLHAGSVYVSALDRSGKQLWQTRLGDFVIHQGYGASPAIYGTAVLVVADHRGSGVVAALDRATGRVVWRQERPAKANYVSPILLRAGGRDQLVLSGCDLVSSFDPNTGNKLWEVDGSTTECVTSVVTDGERVFISGGYPRNHVAAIRADGSGKLDWENNARVYVPSMIVRAGYLYAILDAGVATCWKATTGEEVWKGRLAGTFSSSLVLVNDNLFATNEAGRTYVFRADPGGFRLLAENQLGDESFSTPAVCGQRIYHRAARQVEGKRQEMLYCIGGQP